jgi:hypothetical protein
MKHFGLLLVILTLLVMHKATAQQGGEILVSKSRFIPYLIAGVNWASISGTENANVSPFATFSAGAGFLALINHPAPLSLTVEASYSGQGYRLKNVTRSSSPEYFKLNYLNIPAVLRFTVPNSKFYFGVGPQIGFLIGSRIISQDGSKSNFKEGVLNNTVFDAVGTFGTYFGDHVDTGVELRYQMGLNKFMATAPDYRHSVLQVRFFMPVFIL